MEQYSMAEAARALGVSQRTLTRWMRPAGQPSINRERPWSDMRQRIISRAQLEQLAQAHQRQLRAMDLESVASTLSELFADVAALKQEQADLAQRLARLEQTWPNGSPPATPSEAADTPS